MDTGLGEHLQLEYKSALYDDNDRRQSRVPAGCRDVCQFLGRSSPDWSVRTAGCGRTVHGIARCFDGIERRSGDRFNHLVQFRRNGLLRVSQNVPLIPRYGVHQIAPVGIDLLLRQIVTQAPHVNEAAEIGPPYMLGVTLRILRPLTGVYPAMGGLGEEQTQPVATGEYRLPFLEIDNLVAIDRILRPFCDQVHQMFGREKSPSFNGEGVWIERNR